MSEESGVRPDGFGVRPEPAEPAGFGVRPEGVKGAGAGGGGGGIPAPAGGPAVPAYDAGKVAAIAQPIAPRYVPPDFRQDVPPDSGRPFPNVPRYGRKTRACVVLDRDVYIATAQRALALRLSVSACVNYALAQWVGKSAGTLERPPDVAPSVAPSTQKKSGGP